MSSHVSKEGTEKLLARFEENLDDLTFNSKPLIDFLSRTAAQLKFEGKRVVEIIESRIKKVPSADVMVYWN